MSGAVKDHISGRKPALIRVGRVSPLTAVLRPPGSFCPLCLCLPRLTLIHWWQKSVSISLSTEAFPSCATSLRLASLKDYCGGRRGTGAKVDVHPWFNFPPLPSESSIPSKPFQDPGEGGGGGQPGRFNEGVMASICAYLHPVASNCAFFPEKKDCLFFSAGTLGFWQLVANQPKSTHLCPPMSKNKPKAGRNKPKN